MKLVKSLLLGSAAGLLAVSASQAADLPFRKAAPVEYVRVCNVWNPASPWGGAQGGFLIPGTDTCLYVGGLVFFETQYKSMHENKVGDSDPADIKGLDAFGTRTRARVNVNAFTPTAYGTMRTAISLDFNHNTGLYAGGVGSATSDTFALNYSYIQWAGFTAGHVESVYDFFDDAYIYDAIRDADNTVNLLAYQFQFGGGFAATISMEDHAEMVSRYGDAVTAGAGALATNGGYRSPDFVGAVDFTQSWGAIHVAGAVHENTAFIPGVATADKWGFAILGGVKFNLPVIAPGDEVYLEGQYTEGNIVRGFGGAGGRYLGNTSNGFTDYDGVFVANAAGAISFRMPTTWSVMAAFKHVFTPTVTGYLSGSYIEVKYPGSVLATVDEEDATGARTTNWNEFRVAGRLSWNPIQNLDIGIEGIYARLNQKRPNAGFVNDADEAEGKVLDTNIDQFEARLHIERDF